MHSMVCEDSMPDDLQRLLLTTKGFFVLEPCARKGKIMADGEPMFFSENDYSLAGNLENSNAMAIDCHQPREFQQPFPHQLVGMFVCDYNTDIDLGPALKQFINVVNVRSPIL
jgi:hypothetical protein